MSTTTASQTIHLPSGAVIRIKPFVVVQETPIREWDVQQLYDELEHWINVRARNDGRSAQAYHARSVARPEIARIKRELRRRHLPVDRNNYQPKIYEFECSECQDVGTLGIDPETHERIFCHACVKGVELHLNALADDREREPLERLYESLQLDALEFEPEIQFFEAA